MCVYTHQTVDSSLNRLPELFLNQTNTYTTLYIWKYLKVNYRHWNNHLCHILINDLKKLFNTWMVGSIKWNNIYWALKFLPYILKATNKWKLLLQAKYCMPLYIFHLPLRNPGSVVKMERWNWGLSVYTGCCNITWTAWPQ